MTEAIRRRIAPALLALALCTALQAQTTMRLEVEGDLFLIPELHAAVVEGETGLTVQLAAPSEARTERYRGVDLRAEDAILMINGERVRTVEAFRTAFEAIPVDSTVKIAVGREGRMFLLSFPRMDPADGPKVAMQRVDGGSEDIAPLPEAGLLLRGDGRSITVERLTIQGLDTPELAIEDGDHLLAVNGEPVSTVPDAEKRYQAIAAGATVTLTVERNGERLDLSFEKPETRARIIRERRE